MDWGYRYSRNIQWKLTAAASLLPILQWYWYVCRYWLVPFWIFKKCAKRVGINKYITFEILISLLINSEDIRNILRLPEFVQKALTTFLELLSFVKWDLYIFIYYLFHLFSEKEHVMDTEAIWTWPENTADLVCVLDEAYSGGVEKNIP